MNGLLALPLLLASAAFPQPEYGAIFESLTLPNGLVLDRESDPTTVSVAATGFVAYATAEYAVRNGSDVDAVRERVRAGFLTTVEANPASHGGWLAHFTDAEGRPKGWSEISTIDTALFYMGMRRAAEVLGDTELLSEVDRRLAAVDVESLMRGNYFLHGFMVDPRTGERRVIPHTWNDTSEGLILYRLFGKPFEPEVVRVDFPLFVYVYPLCFFEDEWYEYLLRDAVAHQVEKHGYVGVTATDGPYGYAVDDPQVIAPLLIGALVDRFPEAADTLEKFDLDPRIPSYHLGARWAGSDKLGIDYASAYLISIRPRSGEITRAFASVPAEGR